MNLALVLGGAALAVWVTGCAPGWQGPTSPVEPLPTGQLSVAAALGLPVMEQWTHKGSAFFATTPLAVGHFLALGDRKGQVWFLDPNTGRKRAVIKGKGAIRGELVWDARNLYLVSEHAGQPLQAFRLEGGKRIWYRKFSYPPEAPIKAGDELWLPVGDTLYALNPETGDVVRTIVAGGDQWGTPVPTGFGAVLWGRNGVLMALGPFGQRLWSVELNLHCSAKPVVSGDTLWISTTSGSLVCLAGEGSMILERNFDSTALFSVAVESGRLYVGSAAGNLWAVSAADLSVLWEQSLGAPLAGSPLVREEWVATALLDGRVEFLDAESGALRDSISYASILPFAPAWAFGRLYVVDSDRRVHALGKGQ